MTLLCPHKIFAEPKSGLAKNQTLHKQIINRPIIIKFYYFGMKLHVLPYFIAWEQKPETKSHQILTFFACSRQLLRIQFTDLIP